jgi:hypothetical protein
MSAGTSDLHAWLLLPTWSIGRAIRTLCCWRFSFLPPKFFWNRLASCRLAKQKITYGISPSVYLDCS